MSTAPSGRTAESRTYLVFMVGESTCALPVEQIAELLPGTALTVTPGSPSLLAGFLNLEGSAVAVVALCRLLYGVSHEATADDVLIMLRNVEPPMALLATAAREIVRLPQSSVVTMSHLSMSETGLISDEQIIPILSQDRLLLEEERRRLAELRAAEQNRLADLASPEPAAV